MRAVSIKIYLRRERQAKPHAGPSGVPTRPTEVSQTLLDPASAPLYGSKVLDGPESIRF